MHVLNVLEVLYDAMRRNPEQTLAQLLTDLADLGLRVDRSFDDELVSRAATLKAHCKRVSLADCVGIAFAEACRAPFFSSDHHELDALAATGHRISFIR